jgi:two-component system chemotaxis response regulator CheY
MKILLAEDDFASRKFAQKFLSKYGVVDATTDGEEAVAAWELAYEDGERYDLICLDIMMPKIDGVEALARIRDAEAHANIPFEKQSKIIMITALSDMKYVDGAFELGCDGYATKPLNTVKFEEVLGRMGLLDNEL